MACAMGRRRERAKRIHDDQRSLHARTRLQRRTRERRRHHPRRARRAHSRGTCTHRLRAPRAVVQRNLLISSARVSDDKPYTKKKNYDHAIGAGIGFVYVVWLLSTARELGFPRDE